MAATDSGGTTVRKSSSRSSPAAIGQGSAGAVAAHPEAVRVADMVDPGEERPHPGVVPGLAGGEGHRPIRPAVEGAHEGDDLAAPGGPAGQLEGPLDRLGTAVAEEHRVEPRGRHVHQGLGGRHQLGMVGGPRDVPETIDLLVHRPHHGGVPVPEVGDPDAAGEVEHRPAVHGVQPGALSGVHDQVAVPAEGGRDQLTVLLQKGRDGHAVIGGRSVHGTSSRCVEGVGSSGRADAFPGQVTPHR